MAEGVFMDSISNSKKSVFKFSFLIFAFVFAASIFSIAHADDVSKDQMQPDVVKVPLSKVYVPGGFDSNDRVRLMVEGYFPSTCYRVAETTVSQTEAALSISQTAFKYNGPCIWMMISYSQPVNVGILKSKTYDIKDSDSGRVMGQLPVKVAVNAGPDDFLYANVKDAYLGFVDGQKRAIVISGVLPGDCWALKEKRVIQDGPNVVTVLPIIEKKEKAECHDLEMPFIATVDVPNIPAGRYMLNVRSLSGESIIKLVDL
jgi:hypothetical protein